MRQLRREAATESESVLRKAWIKLGTMERSTRRHARHNRSPLHPSLFLSVALSHPASFSVHFIPNLFRPLPPSTYCLFYSRRHSRGLCTRGLVEPVNRRIAKHTVTRDICHSHCGSGPSSLPLSFSWASQLPSLYTVPKFLYLCLLKKKSSFNPPALRSSVHSRTTFF